jgi:hypothetical protein
LDKEKDSVKNPLEDFVDDTEYYQIKRDKQQVENATWAIYIFTAISFVFFTIYLLINIENFSWINCVINLALIGIYFFLGIYSQEKPFTAFITIFFVLGAVFLLDIFLTGQLSLRGIVVKVVLVVYIAMRLEIAKRVQEYENKHAK